MNQQEWLNAVARHLCRSGLPEAYVRRTCGELADHAEQCLRAGRRFETLDESPDELCQALVVNYRRRSLIGRLPPALCLIVPVVLAIIMPVAYYVGVGIAFDVVAEGLLESPIISKIEAAVIWTVFYVGIAAVPLICSATVAWFVRQMARPWGWSVMMFGLLFWVTFSTYTSLEIVGEGADLSVGVNLTRECVGSLYHWAQCLAVIVVGLICVLKQRYKQQQKTVSV